MTRQKRDGLRYTADGWSVIFGGRRETARWPMRGPAEAHLRLLQSGYRAADPETVSRSTEDRVGQARRAN